MKRKVKNAQTESIVLVPPLGDAAKSLLAKLVEGK